MRRGPLGRLTIRPRALGSRVAASLLATAFIGGCASFSAGGQFGLPRIRPGSDLVLPEPEDRSLARALLDPCNWPRSDTLRVRPSNARRCQLAAVESVTGRDVERAGTTQKVP